MWKLIASLALAFASEGSIADESSPNQGLLGDWGGLRTRLHQQGIDFQLGYIAEPSYNATGGDSHLLRNADEFRIGSTLVLDKLASWSNAKFQVTITERHGDSSLSADAHLGTLGRVQEIYGRGQTWRWTQFWYDQKFFDETLDLKLGRLGVGEDFMSFSCYFQNITFCGSLPGNLVSTWFNWPVSQWGARAKYRIAPDWYAETGIYEVNPGYLETKYAFRLESPPGSKGFLVPTEVGWTPHLGPAALPGSYRVGVWYDSSNQPDVFQAADGKPRALNASLPARMRNSESGGYVMLQQQVTTVRGDVSRGLRLIANFIQADRDTATLDQFVMFGFFFYGPFDARPRDDVGFTIGRTHVNKRIGTGRMLSNAIGPGTAPIQDSEYPVEVDYSVVATRWLTLRPNIQYIHHPRGIDQNPDVVVLGLKVLVVF